MKKNLLSIFLLGSFATASASHFQGGELTCDYNGNNYTVTLAMYKTCAPSSAYLPASNVINFQSASLGLNFSRTVNHSYDDTTSLACPPNLSVCASPTSSDPGYITGYYKDTVSLPSAPDWVISTSVSARTLSNNIQNSISTTYYTEAKLNNLAGTNVNAYIPNTPVYFLAVNNTETIPLQTIDADGDSVAYEFVTPMTSAVSTISYAFGYSLASPFGSGSSCTLNAASQTLAINATATGNYTIAFKVKEYRSGNLIASYIREQTFTVRPAVLPTFPMASPGQFYATACPGHADSVMLSFTDVPADSVFVTVSNPSIPGWTFSSSTFAGAGNGSAYISWIAPSTLNPATTPYVYVNIFTRDNKCPRAVARYALLIKTGACPVDSVWPGDANNDKVVNLLDPLYVAIAFGHTGPARPAASNTWVAQYCAPWANNLPLTSTNEKHADCNGNGTVGLTDLAAITANYGLVHTKPAPWTAPAKVTGNPDLYFDLAGIDFVPGKTISIPVKIGNSSIPVAHLYGIATRISVSNLPLTSTPVVTNANSILGGNALNFSYDYSTVAVDWVNAKTDQSEFSGNGLLGTITFTIPASTPVGKQINLNFSQTNIVDKNGAPIQCNILNTSATVAFPAGVQGITTSKLFAAVIPNPSQEPVLQFYTDKKAEINIVITDVMGKVVWQQKDNYSNSMQAIVLPCINLSNGMYMVHINSSENVSYEPIKWLKQ